MPTARSTLWMTLLLLSALSMQINAQTKNLDIKMPCMYLDPNDLKCDATVKTCTGTIHFHLGTANDVFLRRQYKILIPSSLDLAQKVKASVDPIKVNGKVLGSRYSKKSATDERYTYDHLADNDKVGYIRIQLGDSTEKIKEYHEQIETDNYLLIPYQASTSTNAVSAADFSSGLIKFLETSALNTKSAIGSEGIFLTKVEIEGKTKGRAIILARAFEISETDLSTATGFESPVSVVPTGHQDTEKPSKSAIHYTNCKLTYPKDITDKMGELDIKEDYVRWDDLVLQLLQDQLRSLDLHHRGSALLHLYDRLEP